MKIIKLPGCKKETIVNLDFFVATEYRTTENKFLVCFIFTACTVKLNFDTAEEADECIKEFEKVAFA